MPAADACDSLLRSGAVALVTGASSGIGLAIGNQLLDRGLKVICMARDQGRLEAAFAGKGDRALPWVLDVTDGAAVAALPNALPLDFRQIDILIANAGSDVGGRAPFDSGDIEDWAGTIETNVTGVIRVCHGVIPGMLARGRGHIVTLGSVAGLRTYPGGAIYAASKYALRAFTEGLRQDYKNTPLRVTEISPGLVATGFAEARHKGDAARAEAYYGAAVGCLQPGDIAASVLFALEQPAHVNIAQIIITPTTDK